MMDEKMRAAFSLWRRDQEFPPMAHEIADWVLNYLRSQQEPVGCVGYLDIGIGGYIDIGSDLSDEELLKLPPGRYALKPDGIFGVDGYRPIPSAPAVPDGWLRAVDTEMITTYLGVANADDDYETARDKLHQIIDWHVSVALDPAVNGGKVLVPIEPTVQMFESFDGWSPPRDKDYAGGQSVTSQKWWDFRHRYCAMLAAAPSPTEKKES